MKKIRIGSGAGYSGDRLEPALHLMQFGRLDYICFECLAERTIALAQKEKQCNPNKGYNPLLEYRMEKVLPLSRKHGVKVITNMGAANPESAMSLIGDLASRQNLKGLKIAAVLGDDIFGRIENYIHLPVLETGQPLADLSDRLISANAYLGAMPIVEALRGGADIVITGRVADPSLFLAPLIYEFGWTENDYGKLGRGTLTGHLLECAAQVSGGYFADPGKKDAPDLWNVGFPFAEVDEEGNGFISKVGGTGGRVSVATCTEQMIYEIHDPERYITPDCVADFSGVYFTELEKDKVACQGGKGAPATDFYKVSVGYQNGYFAEGQISYGGANCVERAQLAMEIVRRRLDRPDFHTEDLRIELMGINSVSPLKPSNTQIPEVRLRVACRTESQSQAARIVNEVETLYTNGPAGGGGVTGNVEEVISIASVLVPKSDIQAKVVYLQM
ncbi:MAG: acyclic terpene utilization AtuA family protein [Bacteroidia bacterium]